MPTIEYKKIAVYAYIRHTVYLLKDNLKGELTELVVHQ